MSTDQDKSTREVFGWEAIHAWYSPKQAKVAGNSRLTVRGARRVDRRGEVLTRALRDARDAYLIVAFFASLALVGVWIGRAL